MKNEVTMLKRIVIINVVLITVVLTVAGIKYFSKNNEKTKQTIYTQGVTTNQEQTPIPTSSSVMTPEVKSTNEATESPKTTETSKAVESPKPTESSKPTESPKPTQTTESTYTPKPTIAAQSVGLDIDEMVKKVEDYLSTKEGKYGVYYINLVSNQEFGIRATDEYIAASTSKLPMNLLLYKKIAAGEIDPDQILVYEKEDFEAGSGVIQKQPHGTEYTVRETARLSIVYSDNCGINMIIRLLGIDNIRNYMTELGGSIYYGSRHRSCPKDMAIYLKELYSFYQEEPEIAGELIENLQNTVFNDRINLLLPKDVKVAHKIGNFTRTANDVGIVFAEQPYILSIMSENVDFKEGCLVLANISKIIYDYSQGMD